MKAHQYRGSGERRLWHTNAKRNIKYIVNVNRNQPGAIIHQYSNVNVQQCGIGRMSADWRRPIQLFIMSIGAANQPALNVIWPAGGNRGGWRRQY
jgi:hypothetical protein